MGGASLYPPTPQKKMSAHHGFTYDFSIWYCPADDGVASSIAEFLQAHGFQGYAEHQDRVAGTCAVQSAAEAIRASRVAILILSAEALGDPWCRRISEWSLQHLVQRGGTRVIPVCVGVRRDEVPLLLRHLNRLEFHTEFFFQRLLRSLARAGAVPKATS